ncbi:MAG: hypothetical protein JW982_14970 [Spirochaetes bacterium]|nr:hypothetical protein [Spirochaetota bacterium]
MPSAVICNPDVTEKIIRCFNELEINPVLIPRCNDVAFPVSGHPDIQVFSADDNLFCHRNIDRSFVNKSEKFYNIIICDEILSGNYPRDINFNCMTSGNFFFHKLNCTSEKILTYMKETGRTLVNVNQGYTGCSTLRTGVSIITSDTGIYEASVSAGIDSLLISSGNINLPGYKYGFIGGCSGISKNTVYLSGTLENHPDSEKIISFFKKNSLALKYLSDDTITDYGSFIIRDY